jgi:predicted RNA-binding Zn-ribbon protein involved in translation (DUF1610 family)
MKCASCGYPVSNKAALLPSFECPKCGAVNYVEGSPCRDVTQRGIPTLPDRRPSRDTSSSGD